MFVTDGAQKQLLKDERQRFIEKEWPQIAATIKRLGLEADYLLREIDAKQSSAPGGKDD
jgi:hypothetical protein